MLLPPYDQSLFVFLLYQSLLMKASAKLKKDLFVVVNANARLTSVPTPVILQ